MDDLWFSRYRLGELIDGFAKRGGKYLFLDEVHKYPNWSQELKNAYDDFPELHIVFTGSSLLEILNARADLSRRAVVYEIQGLSFREYLSVRLNENFPLYTLQDILENQRDISIEVVKKVKPLRYFPAYLEHGYYPFSFEMEELYYTQLEEVINLILEIELPLKLAGKAKTTVKSIRLATPISISWRMILNMALKTKSHCGCLDFCTNPCRWIQGVTFRFQRRRLTKRYTGLPSRKDGTLYYKGKIIISL